MYTQQQAAACHIQNAYRLSTVKRKFRFVREQAAGNIQRVWRGYSVRKNIQEQDAKLMAMFNEIVSQADPSGTVASTGDQGRVWFKARVHKESGPPNAFRVVTLASPTIHELAQQLAVKLILADVPCIVQLPDVEICDDADVRGMRIGSQVEVRIS
jgi:hypothetical protein